MDRHDSAGTWGLYGSLLAVRGTFLAAIAA